MSCNCGCNGADPNYIPCPECEALSDLEQLVLDAVANEKTDLEHLRDDAKGSADAAAKSADEAAQSAGEAKHFRDDAQVAANSATGSLKTIMDNVLILEESGKLIQQAADDVLTAIASIAVRTWYYTITTDGQTQIPVPANMNVLAVQNIYIEGVRQDLNRGFTFDKQSMTITLARGLPKGMEITVVLGAYNTDPANNFPLTLASNNGANLVGSTSGKTVQAELDALKQASGNFGDALNPVWQRMAAESGYTLKGSFEDGAILANATDAIVFKGQGKLYKWAGTLPKTVTANSNPGNTGGITATAWVQVDQDTLRTTVMQTITRVSQLESITKQVEKVSDLVNLMPEKEGQVVLAKYAVMPAAHGITVGPVGGGTFIAFNDLDNVTKDGGVFVDSPHATLKWKRINFTSYDPQFWGVIADGITDNAAAIEKAHKFAASKRIILDYPPGIIMTSKTVPIYDSMGMRGTSRQEGTAIQKTTNDLHYYYNADGSLAHSVNALVATNPVKWDRASPYMESFCNHWTLENIMFRRNGLTEATWEADHPYYGLYAPKAASFRVHRCNFEGAFVGIGGYVHFSANISYVGCTNWKGKGYAGYQLEDFRDGNLMSAGTSMILDTFQARGMQFGIQCSRLQYSTFRACSFEEISPTKGETISYAVKFIDPFSITLDVCATEFVTGGQIQLGAHPNPGFRPSIAINNWFCVDQQNPAVPHPIIDIDNGGVVQYTVDIVGGDLTLPPSAPNITAPKASGAGVKVFTRATTGATKNLWVNTGAAQIFDPEHP